MSRAYALGIAATISILTFFGTYAMTGMDPLHAGAVAAGVALGTFALGLASDRRLAVGLVLAGLAVAGASWANYRMAGESQGSVHGSDGVGLGSDGAPQGSGDGKTRGSSDSASSPTSTSTISPTSAHSISNATPSLAGNSKSSSIHQASPSARSTATYEFLLAPKYAASGAPNVSAEVRAGPSGTQRITVTASGLGMSTIELDVNDSGGGTIFGESTGSVDDMTWTLDYYPPSGGTWNIAVTNKDNGQIGLATVNMTADPGPVVVRPYSGTAAPTIVATVQGRACDPSGARISIKYTNIGSGNLHFSLSGGDFGDAGIGGDSVGVGYHALGIRASACTGGLTDPVTLTARSDSGQTTSTVVRAQN